MRLTLRTLLAYMDDILDPADHEDLGEKIEASDFATELIHRSRDTVRRLRLGAPPVIDESSDDVLDGVNLSDPNAVAEYLDNTLPPEQVAEFERMCLEQGLEPDMHLAEVASCHHVLTMVLGEPAEVDAALKSRMYKLPEQIAGGEKLRIEPSHSAPPVAPPPQALPPQEAVPPVQAAPPAPQSAPVVTNELPDYLREAAAAQRSSRRWAIGTTLAALAGIVFWFASVPEAEPPGELASQEQELAGLSAGQLDIAGLDDMVGTEPSISEDTNTEAPPFDPGPGEVSAAPPFQPGDAEPVTEAEPEMDLAPVVDLPFEAIPPAAELAEDLESPTTEAETPEYPRTETPEADPLADALGGGEAEAPLLVASVPKTPVEEAPMVELPVADEGLGEITDETEFGDQETDTAPTGPQQLGNYPGNNDVLLAFNSNREKWMRIAPRTPITTGDRLLTLPKYRTHVVLADLNAYLCGATQLRIPVDGFDTLSPNTELHLQMVYGRLLLSAGLNGSQVAMRIEDEQREQQREFHLEGSASLAVDVDRLFVPGSDYENEAAPTKATWYLTTGSVEWPTPAGGTQTITGPAMWTTIDGIDEIPTPVDELPQWIDREPVTNVEFRARNNLAQELSPGEPVGIRLLELTEGEGLGRQKEVRILAAASSLYVGEFEPLVKALNDSDQSRAWDEHLRDLRQALALSPEVAQQVRQALVSNRGEEAAADLMEMLLGYDDQQIGQSRDAVQTGAVLKLLEWLDHDSLDYRVLASHNLQEITGKSPVKGYRPDDSPKRRRISLRKIWDDFESHELVPR